MVFSELARELVAKLYFRAKSQRVPMTRLANRLIETALDAEQMVECRRDTNSDTAASGEHTGLFKSPAIAPR